MNIRPRTWWIVFGVLIAAAAGAWALLSAQGMPNAGRWAFTAVDLVATVWVVFGLIRWRQTPAVRKLAAFLGFTIAAQLVASFFVVLGSAEGVIAVAGIWGMAVAFFGGLLLIRLALTPGYPIIGVARTLVDEAIRMRAPLVFIVALLIILPVLPFVLDPQDRLEYRIQTFLTWSMTAVSVLLSLMTIFLAVGTVTREVQDKQIFLTMTKPVSRAGYLVGKWLGISALNLLLIAVCGAGIFAFTRILEQQPATSPDDAQAVQQEVLVARAVERPVPPSGTDLAAAFRERLERLRTADPVTYGEPDAPVEDLPARLRDEVQKLIVTEWYAVAPRDIQGYLFTGLREASTLGGTVQLRINPQPAQPLPDAQVALFLRYNGRPDPRNPWRLAEGQYHVLDVPTEVIDEQGRLLVEIANLPYARSENVNQPIVQPTITFNTADGIELLYRVGGFTSNFARGLLILWIRLCFLAMLGVAAGTFLGFPVACLLAIMVYIAATASGYLNDSVSSYAAIPGMNAGLGEQLLGAANSFTSRLGEGAIYDAVKVLIGLLGRFFLLLVPSLGEYEPIGFVAGGRSVPLRMVGDALLWVGVIWTGLIGFLAWLIFRNRELARVTV